MTVLMRSYYRGLSSDVPLFYQPGKAGFYAPRVGAITPERLNAYRNVGRMIGLSLLFSEAMPLPLCRHVIKFMLIRNVTHSPSQPLGMPVYLYYNLFADSMA